MLPLPPQYERLKAIRTKTDLTVPPNTFLRETFRALDGTERPLKLRYYQVQGILHLLVMKRFLLGDDTGLGKTLQTIVSLSYIWDKNPKTKAVVLTSKSAVGQWAGEFDKFCKPGSVRAYMCVGTPKQREKIRAEYLADPGPSVLVMGYRTAVGDFDALKPWRDYVLVTDEASAYKNNETQVHQVVKHLSYQADRTWALTATLIKNDLIEGWGIYSVVVPGLFGVKNNFMMEYCITVNQRLPGTRKIVPVIVGYRARDVAAFREMIDPYFLSRAKHEVASELPPLTVRHVTSELTRWQRDKYQEALAGLLLVGKAGEEEEKEVTKLTAVTYCQQIVNHPELIGAEGDSGKLDSLMDLLTEGELAGSKVIVFSRFRTMIDVLGPVLRKAGIKAVRITGDENERERKASQDAFQSPESDVQVCFLTMAGAEAINLQAAKAMVFYDSPWSAGDYIQLLGRMIRIGSTHDRCYAIHLLAEGTIDQRVAKVLAKKMELVEAVLGKRIKNEDETVMVSAQNDLSDLFASLQDDARATVAARKK